MIPPLDIIVDMPGSLNGLEPDGFNRAAILMGSRLTMSMDILWPSQGMVLPLL